MFINSIRQQNNTKEPVDTLSEAAEYLKNMIELGTGEVDEQKLREKYDAKIQAKLQSGKRLTAKEMKYLQKYNPVMYAHAVRIEMKRRSVEEKLKHARSKEEVEEIQFEAISTISKKDPVREYMVAVCDAVAEFKKTEHYRRLPETEEKNTGKEDKLLITYEVGAGAYQMAFAEEESDVTTGFMAIS